MKHIMLAAGFALAATAASAADLPPVFTKAPLASNAALSAFYLGATVSGGGSKSEFDFVTIPGTGNLHPTGIMPGVVVGAGTWVNSAWFAVEADASYDFLKSNNACVVVLDCRIKSSFFLTQRAVLGVPLGAMTNAIQSKANASQWPAPLSLPTNLAAAAVMPYLTAGIAERRIEACLDASVIGLGSMCSKQWIAGFAGGAGLRIPVSTHVSLDVSYLYVQYNKSFTPAGTAVIFPTTFTNKNEQMGRFALIAHL